MSETQTFHATGLTCGHCASAVTEEVEALAAVESVTVDVVGGGTSTITVEASRTVAPDEIAAALEEAGGYALVEG